MKCLRLNYEGIKSLSVFMYACVWAFTTFSFAVIQILCDIHGSKYVRFVFLHWTVLCCAPFVFHWFDFYLNWIIYWVYCISNCNAILWFCLVVKLNFYSLFNFYCFTLLYFHSFVIIQLDWMWFFRYKMSGSILLLLRREKEILNGWDMWCF